MDPFIVVERGIPVINPRHDSPAHVVLCSISREWQSLSSSWLIVTIFGLFSFITPLSILKELQVRLLVRISELSEFIHPSLLVPPPFTDFRKL